MQEALAGPCLCHVLHPIMPWTDLPHTKIGFIFRKGIKISLCLETGEVPAVPGDRRTRAGAGRVAWAVPVFQTNDEWFVNWDLIELWVLGVFIPSLSFHMGLRRIPRVGFGGRKKGPKAAPGEHLGRSHSAPKRV